MCVIGISSCLGTNFLTTTFSLRVLLWSMILILTQKGLTQSCAVNSSNSRTKGLQVRAAGRMDRCAYPNCLAKVRLSPAAAFVWLLAPKTWKPDKLGNSEVPIVCANYIFESATEVLQTAYARTCQYSDHASGF